MNCKKCGVHLIVGLTAALTDLNAPDPELRCLNCDTVNQPDRVENAVDVLFSTDCVMCGQEWGTALRADKRYYCARCWQTWIS